jgi:hypothetical protein
MNMAAMGHREQGGTGPRGPGLEAEREGNRRHLWGITCHKAGLRATSPGSRGITGRGR